MYIYIKDRHYYYDWSYLKAITGFSSSKLRFLLDRDHVERVNFRGTLIYRLDDLYKSSLAQYIQPTIVEVKDEEE